MNVSKNHLLPVPKGMQLLVGTIVFFVGLAIGGLFLARGPSCPKPPLASNLRISDMTGGNYRDGMQVIEDRTTNCAWVQTQGRVYRIKGGPLCQVTPQ